MVGVRVGVDVQEDEEIVLRARKESKLEQLLSQVRSAPPEPVIGHGTVRRHGSGDKSVKLGPPERYRVRAVDRRRCVPADDAYVHAVAY